MNESITDSLVQELTTTFFSLFASTPTENHLPDRGILLFNNDFFYLKPNQRGPTNLSSIITSVIQDTTENLLSPLGLQQRRRIPPRGGSKGATESEPFNPEKLEHAIQSDLNQAKVDRHESRSSYR